MFRQVFWSVDFEAETGESTANEVVEDVPVLLGRVGIEGERVVLAQLDELVGSRLHEIEEVAVPLLRLVPRSAVVRAEGSFNVAQKACVLRREEIELALHDIDEAPTHLPMLPAP
jgi:hypothetical protein